MGLLSFLKRPAAAADAGSLEGLRSRARRRLIGAAVLVVIGVVVLPLLFDTTPRPVAVDIPIEIPAKEKVAPLAASGKPIASGSLAPAPVAAPPPEPAPVAEKPAPKAAEAPPEPPVERNPVEKPAPAPADKPAVAATAKASASAAVASRYVVQVGAFSEASSAREARQRVEKLGLKTYTQVVETPAGARTRVRVGPFDERAEADRTASKIKQAGLPAAVLGL